MGHRSDHKTTNYYAKLVEGTAQCENSEDHDRQHYSSRPVGRMQRLWCRDQSRGRKMWVTISRIALPLKVSTAMATDIAGVRDLTEILDLFEKYGHSDRLCQTTWWMTRKLKRCGCKFVEVREKRLDGNDEYEYRCGCKRGVFLGSPSSACEARWRAFPSPCFQTADSKLVFWHLLPAPVIGGQQHRLPPRCTRIDRRDVFSNPKTERVQPCRVGPYVEEKSQREKILQQLWVSYIKDATDMTNPIQTNTELSYAMALMDNIGSWHEEGKN